MQQDNRIYGLDALRAIAMLLGIILHASIAYKEFPNATWPSDNLFHTSTFDGTYMVIHSFRMQLFYIVAGFFARLLYLKIGKKAFIRHRFKRIVVPFVGSMLLILPFTIAPFLYYKYFISDQLPSNEAWASLRTQFFHWNGMAHLWFLYYLIIFYCCMLFILSNRKILRLGAFSQLRLNPASIKQVLLLGFGVGCIQIFFFREPIVEVSTGILPKISQLVYYGYFFLIGYLLHRNYRQLEGTGKNTWLYMGIGLTLSVGLYIILIMNKEEALFNQTIYILWLTKLAVGLQTTFLAFGMIGFFLRYLNTQSPALKYIADASYWLYLVHLGMVAALQIFFRYTNIPGEIRFGLVLLITGAISLASYEWFIRYTFIGDMLHGPRSKRQRYKKIDQHMTRPVN